MDLKMDTFDLRIIKELTSKKNPELLRLVEFTEYEHPFYKPYLQRPEVWHKRIIHSIFDHSAYPLWGMVCCQECKDSWIPETVVYLDIMDGRITDKKLQTLKNLKYLTLGMNSIITDVGIKDLHNLEYLDLQGNDNITNGGICNLKKLKKLWVGFNTHVTKDGYSHIPSIDTRLIFPGWGEVFPFSNKKRCDN